MAVLAKSRTLHGKGERGTRAGLKIMVKGPESLEKSGKIYLLKGLVVLLVVGHDEEMRGG